MIVTGTRLGQSHALPACLACLTTTLFLAGCGSAPDRLEVYKTRGKVLFDGKPAEGAYVSFHPLSPDIKLRANPRGVVQSDGSFALSTYETDDGAPAGEYKVVIDWRKLLPAKEGFEAERGPSLLPPQYRNPKTSLLKATVKPGVNEIPPFQIVAE